MKTGFIGYGAIASVFMAYGTQLKRSFSIISRNTDPVTLTVEQYDAAMSISPPICTVADIGSYDLIIICVKAYQIKDLILEMQNYLSKNTVLAFINNGMGVNELVNELLPQHACIIGTTSYAALKTTRNHIIQTGKGSTELAWKNQPNNINEHSKNAIEEQLNGFCGATQWHRQIQPHLWTKLAVNAVINPITALHNAKNNIILMPKHLTDVQHICQEIAAVMKAEGLIVREEDLIENVLIVARNTQNNYSSMHQDITFKRPTEIEFINGYVCNIGKKHQIKTPHNEHWWSRIQQIEVRNLTTPNSG
jgi:2-dehydropantoate 2-reductase